MKSVARIALVPGKLEYGVDFDDAFDIWKYNKMKMEINDVAVCWGIDKDWLLKSVNTFTTVQPLTIPYIDELIKSVDYEKATDKSAGNKLKHMMTITRELPRVITEFQQKYE